MTPLCHRPKKGCQEGSVQTNPLWAVKVTRTAQLNV
jgi:hypothetical protein